MLSIYLFLGLQHPLNPLQFVHQTITLSFAEVANLMTFYGIVSHCYFWQSIPDFKKFVFALCTLSSIINRAPFYWYLFTNSHFIFGQD